MSFNARINTIHVAVVFFLVFLFFSPVLLISAQKKSWHRIALAVSHIWAKWFFKLSFLKTSIIYEETLDKKRQYVFCANHFSYLDIPTIGLLGVPVKFIGKSSLTGIPLFGYMFRKIHIAVNRESKVARGISFVRSNEAALEGSNLVFFPEGGIVSKKIPQMNKFLDGAFQLAVNHGLPIVPIVLPDNYQVMPDDESFFIFRNQIRMKVCKPIFPQENSEEAVDQLKNEVYETIQKELYELIQS